jgi:hypothetical protein
MLQNLAEAVDFTGLLPFSRLPKWPFPATIYRTLHPTLFRRLKSIRKPRISYHISPRARAEALPLLRAVDGLEKSFNFFDPKLVPFEDCT